MNRKTSLARRCAARPHEPPCTPACALLAAGLALLAGCRAYEPRPLDATAIREAWLARAPADAPAREYAARLADAERSPNAVVFDPADGLTLAEGEPVALVYNRELRAARLDAGVTRAVAEHAGRWDDPVAGVDLERILSGVSEPWVTAATLGLTIPISGRLDAERAHAGAIHETDLRRLAALEWSTRAALRERWIEWSAHARRGRLADELVLRLRAVADLSRRREQAGSLTRIDARLFRVELAAAESEQISVYAGLEELRLQLCDLLGLAPHAPVDLVETLNFAPPDITDSARTHLDALDARNPELALARANYEAAEQALRLEVRKQYPDLELGAGYGSDQGDDRLLLGVRLPIPLWNRNQQGVARAIAARDAAHAHYESIFEHLGSRLAVAIARHEAAIALRRSIEEHVLPLADEQDADVRRIAELGRIDPLLFLQTIKAQHDAHLRLINARAAEAIAAIRLDALLGPPATTDNPPPTRNTQPISNGGRP